ncbi:MAG: alpha/beta fold hydrolase [Anaerolineae bacterium]|nr:alpha/beta fold hydrolase [Anaerolineae bacterium]
MKSPLSLEVISRDPVGSPKPTPIVFVHGAWHGAWCWEENFLPAFAQAGYPVTAFSLRAHGRSPTNKSIRFLRIGDYLADLDSIIQQIGTPPILIGHSMGGYIVQKYLETHPLPAGILLASIPLPGALPFVLRHTLRHPWPMLKTLLTFNGYEVVRTPALAKDAFFSDSLPDETAARYHARLNSESTLIILDSSLFARIRSSRIQSPMLVIGAANDRVFTVAEQESMARAYGSAAHILPNTAHDLMLERNWRSAVEIILAWLRDHSL